MNSSNIIYDSLEFNTHLKALNASSIVVLTDSNTTKNCLLIARSTALEGLNYKHIEVSAGEGTKTLDSANNIWKKLIELKIDRNAVMVCLGGGMVCDLGGYAASCYKRGIRSTYIPTTNLAMTDAAIGGKTGVNFASTKNQIGTFHLPELVLIDNEYLGSLTTRELHSGFAETIKHALIADRQLWYELQSTPEPWANFLIIQRSARIKLGIIEQDLNDLGIRQALNFGHTIGHAIEAVSHHTQIPLLHGEAILYGMIGEAWLSNQLQLMSKSEFQEFYKYVSNYTAGIPLPQMEAKKLLESMSLDKKNSNGQIVFSLLQGIGSSRRGLPVEPALIEKALKFTLNFSEN